MTDFRNVNADSVLDAIQQHGPAGGSVCMQKEGIAATQSLNSGLYVTFIPRDTQDISDLNTREMYESQHQQCRRIGMGDICLCGHSLSDHKAVSPKTKGFIVPPKCTTKGCRCFHYSYAPSRPEETGQWWLPRRSDFNLKSWRKRVQQKPEEYACIGCNLKVSEHETLFETRKQRVQRGAQVDHEYFPLQNCPELQGIVLGGGSTHDNDSI